MFRDKMKRLIGEICGVKTKMLDVGAMLQKSYNPIIWTHR